MLRYQFRFAATVVAASVALAASAAPPTVANPHPEVRLFTTAGTIVVRLDRDRAPLTVKNFLQYVRAGFYDGTIFHRVVPGFVIQGGGFTAKFVEKPTRAPIPNEAGNGLRNLRGTIAMARDAAPHTATAQFYINLHDNLRLDPRPERWGYAVFGRVISGMDVVDKIGKAKTGAVGPFKTEAPLKTIVIKKAEIVGGVQ